MALDLTIHIPDEYVKDFMQDKFKEFFGRVSADLKYNRTMVGNYEMETLDMLEHAFNEAKVQNKDKVNEDLTFVVRCYYDEQMRGLSDYRQDMSYDEMTEYAHNKLSHGDIVKIECVESGMTKSISPDDYFADFEGEFPFSLDSFNPNIEEELDR